MHRSLRNTEGSKSVQSKENSSSRKTVPGFKDWLPTIHVYIYMQLDFSMWIYKICSCLCIILHHNTAIETVYQNNEIKHL